MAKAAKLKNTIGRTHGYIKSHPKRVFRAAIVILLVLTVAAYAIDQVVTHSTKRTAATLQQAASAAADNNYDRAIATSLRALDKAGTPEGKFQASMSVAGWYYDKGDFDSAIKYYKQAEGLMDGTDVNVYLGVASAAKDAQEVATAREYYQKAIDYYVKNQKDGIYSEDILSLQEKLDALPEK